MEDRFGKMTDTEIDKLKKDLDKELEKRREEKRKIILDKETVEAENNLKNIDLFIALSKHDSIRCNDDNLCEDAWSTIDGVDDIDCIRCYLMSCKKYNKTPDFRLSIKLESYEVYGR